ncbi:MAG: hypothetical protein ACFNOP_08475, partial [Bacteroides sp.]
MNDAARRFVYKGFPRPQEIFNHALTVLEVVRFSRGGLRAYGGTFLVFSDYMRNGIRLAALMKLPVTYVLTHDSIGLGEDGSTHQPIEQIASLRL